MKRPLFILSTELLILSFAFNFCNNTIGISLSFLMVFFSAVSIKNRELKAVFAFVILMAGFSFYNTASKNDEIRLSLEGVEKNYYFAAYEIYKEPKAVVMKGRLFADKNREIKDVSLFVMPKDEYFPGDVIALRGTLEFKDDSRLKLSPYIRKAHITSKGKHIYKPYYYTGSLRKSLNEAALSVSHRKISNLFPSLLTGTKNYLTYEIKESLYGGGIAHIAAVSGLHLSIILGFFFFAFPVKGKIKFLLSVFLCLFMAGISAFSPSVLRASVMALVLITASLSDRSSDGITSLSFFIILTALFCPGLLFSLSTWFSCLSVLGILVFTPYISEMIPGCLKERKLLNFILMSLAVSFSASLMTLPLCLYVFGRFSVLSILLNVFAVPAVSLLLPLLWVEVIIIEVLGIHIPFLDFILTKGCEAIISSASFISTKSRFFIPGYKPFIILSFLILAVLLGFIAMKKLRLRYAAVCFAGFIVFNVLSGYFLKSEQFIIYPDSMSCAAVKNEDRAVLLGNFKNGFEMENMRNALKKYGVNKIEGVLIEEDESVQGLMIEFLNSFESPCLKENYVDCEHFLPYDFLEEMGCSAEFKEKSVSFQFDKCKILKLKGKCDIINTYETKRSGYINTVEL